MGEVFEASDPDAVEAVMQGGYGWKVRLVSGRQSPSIRLETEPLTSQARLDRITWGMNFSLSCGPIGVPTVTQIQSGHAVYYSRGTERAYGPGDIYIPALPDDPYTCRCALPSFTMTIFDPALLSQVADPEPRRGTQQPVRLLGCDPVSAQAAQRWKATDAFVRDNLPDAAAHPLLASNAARLLAAVTLAAFPNNALTEPTIEDRHDAHAVTLRRAVAYIDDNAHRDIAAADIAAACSVTLRSVQLAFQRHLGTTPMEYLRRIRLDHAHRDLLTADSACETVTAVAYRWGFNSSSRFAAAYRRAYGIAPSQTLRQD